MGGPKSIFAIKWRKYNTHVHHTPLKTHFRVARIAGVMCRSGQMTVGANMIPKSIHKPQFRIIEIDEDQIQIRLHVSLVVEKLQEAAIE